MGCFLDCFGLKDDNKKKIKRRIPGKKSLSQEQDHQNYIPLDSDVSLQFDIKENTTSDSNQLKEKQKEAAIEKIKKKVRFNLNVKAYEPIPHNDDDDLGMHLSEGAKWEFNTQTESMASLHYEENNVVASSISTHRYQNCRDDYDEEDDELMMNFDEIEECDNDDDDDDENDDFPGEFKSDDDDDVMISSENLETRSMSVDHLLIGPKSRGRDRSKYVCSVLNPVENLSQWKAVKAKGVISTQYMCEKENLMCNY